MEMVYCIDNENWPVSLEVGKAYPVVINDADPLGLVRVIDESGEDYLYPAERFSHNPPERAS